MDPRPPQRSWDIASIRPASGAVSAQDRPQGSGLPCAQRQAPTSAVSINLACLEIGFSESPQGQCDQLWHQLSRFRPEIQLFTQSPLLRLRNPCDNEGRIYSGNEFFANKWSRPNQIRFPNHLSQSS